MNFFAKIKTQQTTILYSLVSVVMYYIFAYHLQRADFGKLFALYAALFIMAYKLIETNRHNLNLLLGLAILFRVIFLFATPSLSQDFYRFIWDGTLTLNAYNPYETSPQDWLTRLDVLKEIIPNYKTLITGMGSLSAGNPTNYPPLSQAIYAITVWLGDNSIVKTLVAMRVLTLLAEIGIFYVGRKILLQLNLPQERIFWFLLNPFIIIELTGNLHFESLLVFFLLFSLYLLFKNKWKLAAFFFALSVLTKLFSLLLLPLFFYYFIKKKGLSFYKLLGFYTLVILFTALGFLPFYSKEFFFNFTESIGLWFNSFEFNASFYYVLREIGYYFTGYNLIGTLGKVLPVLSVISILCLSFLRKNYPEKNLLTAMLFAFCAYLFFSTTVHPWYLSLPLLLSIFTRYRFMLVWSFTIILSYTAYTSLETSENLGLVSLEYLLVIGVLLFEIYKKPLEKKFLKF